MDPKDHENDLTLVDVPTDCKGFITGKGGATLRQIERECATLMTFCRNEGGDGGIILKLFLFFLISRRAPHPLSFCIFFFVSKFDFSHLVKKKVEPISGPQKPYIFF